MENSGGWKIISVINKAIKTPPGSPDQDEMDVLTFLQFKLNDIDYSSELLHKV